MYNRLLFIIILTTMTFTVKGQTGSPADSILPVVHCNDFDVTGDGSHTEWDKARWFELSKNGMSQYGTRIKIMYSETGIYCLFDCEDHKITATMKGDNLDLWNEDVIEAFFWADQSLPVYFEYELSPLNYELILMIPNYKGRFLGWIPWHYENGRMTRHKVSVKKTNNDLERWFGEFFIPYELMKPMVAAPPKKGDKWRANFYRVDYDNEPSEWYWMPVVNNFHDYLLFGTIEFK